MGRVTINDPEITDGRVVLGNLHRGGTNKSMPTQYSVAFDHHNQSGAGVTRS